MHVTFLSAVQNEPIRVVYDDRYVLHLLNIFIEIAEANLNFKFRLKTVYIIHLNDNTF